MESKPNFSIAMMKACTGHTPSDFKYFQFFTAECERRIRDGAERLHHFADGAQAFDAESESSARASIAEVRRGFHALEACTDWFKSRQDMARRFQETRQSVAETAGAAESDFKLIMQFLGYP